MVEFNDTKSKYTTCPSCKKSRLVPIDTKLITCNVCGWTYGTIQRLLHDEDCDCDKCALARAIYQSDFLDEHDH